MQLSQNLLHLLGGLMMGSAVVIFYTILAGKRRISEGATTNFSDGWKTLAAFGAGTGIGIYLMSHLIQSAGQGPTLPVLGGVLIGAFGAFLVVRKRIR